MLLLFPIIMAQKKRKTRKPANNPRVRREPASNQSGDGPENSLRRSSRATRVPHRPDEVVSASIVATNDASRRMMHAFVSR